MMHVRFPQIHEWVTFRLNVTGTTDIGQIHLNNLGIQPLPCGHLPHYPYKTVMGKSFIWNNLHSNHHYSYPHEHISLNILCDEKFKIIEDFVVSNKHFNTNQSWEQGQQACQMVILCCKALVLVHVTHSITVNSIISSTTHHILQMHSTNICVSLF